MMKIRFPIKQTQAWPVFASKALLITAIFYAGFEWVESRYRIGVDPQTVRCLPDHKYFLVDMERTTPARDIVVAYESQGLAPYFDDGTMMAKYLRGMPGDHLRIDEKGVSINGVTVAEGFALAPTLGVSASDFYRDETIPEGHYLLLAPAGESFDGRYWGYITADQLVGHVTPLW